MKPYVDSIIVTDDYHSAYDEILSTEDLTIEPRKQMVVHGELILDGNLLIEGNLISEL